MLQKSLDGIFDLWHNNPQVSSFLWPSSGYDVWWKMLNYWYISKYIQDMSLWPWPMTLFVQKSIGLLKALFLFVLCLFKKYEVSRAKTFFSVITLQETGQINGQTNGQRLLHLQKQGPNNYFSIFHFQFFHIYNYLGSKISCGPSGT